jgi:hypothetical protein
MLFVPELTIFSESSIPKYVLAISLLWGGGEEGEGRTGAYCQVFLNGGGGRGGEGKWREGCGYTWLYRKEEELTV